MSTRFPTFAKVADWLISFLSLDNLRRRVIPFDPLVFLREVAAMLRSGVPLHQALAFSTDSFGPKARRHLDALRVRVEAGENLSEALTALPKRFAPDTLRATIAAGERSGRLPDLLEELSREFERLNAFDHRIRSAFVYPLVVLSIAAMVVTIAMAKFVPVLDWLYDALGFDLPLLLRLIKGFWDIFGPVLLIGFPILLVYNLSRLRKPAYFGAEGPFGRYLAWRLPIVRGLRRALIELRFARTLSFLLDAELPLPEALDICEEVVADDLAGRAIVDSARRIRAGEQPSAVLRGLSFLSPAFLWFVADCEKRGDLLEVTRAMAEAAEERFITRIEVAERFLEPVSTLILGLLVGLVVISLYQTMFQLAPMVGD